jgi:adenine-specific DNA-methyltransferase
VQQNGNPSNGFIYKTVPHITLKSIAQNVALDPIFAKHEPILEEKLRAANAALAKVGDDLRHKLEAKVFAKQRAEGKKAITDADRRRWLLPPGNRDRSAEAKKRATVDLEAGHWYAWEVPFDTDPDWPKALQDAVAEYRRAWRAKMDEVNACIAASAEPEELVDQPEIVKGVVRVSGPFTVEAVQPPEMSLGDVMGGRHEGTEAPRHEGEDENLGELATFEVRPVELGVGGSEDMAAYLDKMVRLLRGDGVTFPNNQHVKFTRLDATFQNGRSDVIHAEGVWAPSGAEAPAADATNTVAVTFGPQYGPVTASQVVEAARVAFRRGYTDLVAAGFSFDAAAFDEATNYPNPRLKIHIATIRPDVNPAMDGLLKERPGSQLFTVFGQPRTSVKGPDADGQFTVAMEGVDIYNPVENRVVPSGAENVAAWFLDSDYDGQTFCITQAFFPDRGAWEKLSRALNGKDGLIDAERFEALSGTVSLPFPPGKHKAAAIKVIDPRGNEVMTVHSLGKIGQGK